ncbi:glycosyltransferase family 4 protein [Streptomyces prunicolor]|uniref:glycosyltransferase family 4 protein n=1 Tax=Streptomyces prunicolor TaxID=67348 RepID=UPI0037D26C02
MFLSEAPASRQSHGTDRRLSVLTGSADAHGPCDGVRVKRHRLLDLSVAQEGDAAAVEELRHWFRRQLTASDDTVRLIHGHNLHHFSSAPAHALAALRKDLGLVLLHTYHSIWRRPEDERIARDCAVWDVHHAVSDFLVSECTEVLQQEVRRTYLGVNTSVYSSIPELRETSRHPVVLLPARLIPNKGAMVAITMLKHLLRRVAAAGPGPTVPRPRLVLTDPFDTVDFHGERGDFRRRLSRHIEGCGLTEGPGQDVEFRTAGIGHMAKLYEEATVVVYPSRFEEPMGLAPLEAMCAGRPVVATGVGGLGEGGSTLVALDKGKTDDEDEDELASRFAEEVWRLLSTPGEARRAGRAAREHVRANFDLEQVYVEPMLDEYERLLGTS